MSPLNRGTGAGLPAQPAAHGQEHIGAFDLFRRARTPWFVLIARQRCDQDKDLSTAEQFQELS
jgi:hypothetical protein